MSFFHQLPYIIAAGMQRKVVAGGWQVSHLGILKFFFEFQFIIKMLLVILIFVHVYRSLAHPYNRAE
jgi:hypothetical protein